MMNVHDADYPANKHSQRVLLELGNSYLVQYNGVYTVVRNLFEFFSSLEI